jgi:hypothetical protein
MPGLAQARRQPRNPKGSGIAFLGQRTAPQKATEPDFGRPIFRPAQRNKRRGV